MLNNFESSLLARNINGWFSHHIWTTDALFEISSIIFSFAIGAFLGRILYDKATKAIEKSKLPIRTKRMAKNSRRVLFPLCSMAILFVITEIAGADIFALDISLSLAVLKALLAFIAIRLSFQFMDNAIIRNISTWAIWVIAALSIFGVLDATSKMLDSAAVSIGSFHVSLLEIIKTILLLVILLYCALFISTFFERKVLQSKNLKRSSQVLVVKIIRMSLVVFAIVIGITSSGIDLSFFTVFSGAVGLGVGFGLQRVASNLFSGLLLLMDESINPGDVIELPDGSFGTVNQMAARYTEILTRDCKSHLVPNEDFISQRVINWSHGNKFLRLAVNFGVHYNSNPHDVIRLSLEAVKKLGGRVIIERPPECDLKEFGDSAINFVLHFWIADPENGVANIKGDVLLALWDVFKANKIEIPYPHREIFINDKNLTKI